MSEIQNTQIRIPQNVYEKIQQYSKEIGISNNAFMLMLFKLGLKVFEGEYKLEIKNQS